MVSILEEAPKGGATLRHCDLESDWHDFRMLWNLKPRLRPCVGMSIADTLCAVALTCPDGVILHTALGVSHSIIVQEITDLEPVPHVLLG